jgi:hypothetical protein
LMASWFGEPWGAPACDPDSHTETPVGQPCAECERSIAADDQGMLIPWLQGEQTSDGYMLDTAKPTELAYHLDCFLRLIGADC